LDNISEGFYITDLRHRITYFNHAAEKLLNKKAPDIIGKPLSRAFPELLGSDLHKQYNTVVKTKEAQCFQTHFEEGSNVGWYEVRVYPQETGYSVFFRSITEQKELELKLRENEEWLNKKNEELALANRNMQQIMNSLIESNNRNNALLAAIPDLMFVYDKNGVFIDFHAANSETLLVPPEVFLHKSADDILPPYIARINRTAIERLFETGESQSYSYILNVKGIDRYFDARMVLLGSDKAMSIVRDITEQRNAELELREKSDFINAILKAIPIPVFYKDKQGKYMGCNPAYTDHTGLTESEITGKTVSEIFKTELSEVYHQKDMELMRTGGLQQYEFQILDKQGKIRPVIFAKNVFYDRNNNVAGIIGAFVDVSELKQIQNELIKSKEKAEESDRLKTAFLANMSHEIRTPMNSILGFAELLKNPDINETQQKRFLSIIEDSGNRMLATINDIVDIARIESGQMTVNLEEVSVNELINKTFLSFYHEAGKKNLQISTKVGLHDAASVISTDENKLNSIVTNLVKNAIKFTDHGNIEFGYTLQSDHIEFFVSDTGIGIPFNRQEAIFERFVQADIEDSKAYQGAGLGLAIAKALVEMLGGKIWCESAVGKGSEFYFTIPYKNAGQKSADSKENKLQESESKTSLNILIVEDDAASSLYLAELLQKQNHEVVFAQDGFEAVEKFRNTPNIDLILMDIRLPNIDGYMATSMIREFDNHVTIIAQTAHALHGDRERALEAGCNDYISKPINVKELRYLIEKHTRKIIS
jgi:hypothetical protein